jgi:hypothetical protein
MIFSCLYEEVMVSQKNTAVEQQEHLLTSHPAGVLNAEVVVKRCNNFWKPFNTWWRAYYAKHNKRPGVAECKA